MLKYLRDAGCINFSKLLLLKAKELEVNDNECHILLIILALDEIGVKTITPQLILNHSSLNNKKLDDVLYSLVKKKMIYNRLGSIKIDKLEEKLLANNVSKDVVENEFNLVEVFEEQFGRTLSPIEMNIIKEWKGYGYQDEMIVMALKEAVKGQVLNFRYIEGILNNWAKNGVSRRYIDTQKEDTEVTVSNYEWWKDV